MCYMNKALTDAHLGVLGLLDRVALHLPLLRSNLGCEFGG